MASFFLPYSFKCRSNRVLNLKSAIEQVFECNNAGFEPSLKEVFICAFLLLWPFRRIWL